MKHLIIFLNYCQSRIQNPVYRQFAATSLVSRNATLLFLSKPLEERELLHEVNELRRKEENPSDISFHICATLDHVEIGSMVVQTLTLIRKNFALTDTHAYHSFCYCLLPDLLHCSDKERNSAWKSLVSINNAVTDYLDIHLLQTCFLYTDATQVSLSQFLFNLTQNSSIEQKLYVPLGVTGDFPPVFATFNATGISYPDDEVRYHLHQAYLNALLTLTQAKDNPVDMEQCNQEAEAILALVPLSNMRVCLQEEMFINLNPDTDQSWDVPSTYWQQSIDLSCQGMNDLPREEWFRQMRNRVEVLFQSRFRDLGVEFFFNLEQKKTSDYCRVLLAIISDGLHKLMLQSPYPPSVLKDIVHAIVNRLQQKVLEINQLLAQSQQQVKSAQAELDSLTNQWNNLGLFDRLRGKNQVLLSQYKTLLQSFFEQRTLIPGCSFANKLLNELIPQVAALSDGSDRLTACCYEALLATHRSLTESEPASLCGIFPIEPIHQAAQAISLDREHLFAQYLQLTECLYSKSPILDGEDLLQRLRTKFSTEIDQYLNHRIQDGTLPAVLDVTIVDRLVQLYEGHGGLAQFVEELKKETAFNLMTKDEGGQESYVLVAPENDALGEHVAARDDSHLQMLHVQLGLSLQQLDGFAGKRMFVEPSIF